MPVLNVETIRRRKPGTKRIKIADAAARGLMLIVETTGTKRFVLRYKSTGEDGQAKDRKHALGTFGDGPGEISLDRARVLVAEWRERMKRGEYPHLVREEAKAATEKRIAEKAAAPTVATLVELFREKYLAVNCRNPDARLVTAKKWLLDDETGIGAMPLADVRRQHLNAILDRIVAAGKPVAAYALGRLLGQMFRFAVDEELIEASPAERLQKGTMHTTGDRVLDDGEIQTLWKALDNTTLRMSTAVRHALRVALVTGCRAGEIASAKWEHVKLEGKEPTWTIPAMTAKMGRAHLVPLSPLAVSQFKALKALTGDTPFVLPAAERVRGVERAGERDTVPESHMEAHAIAVAIRRCRDMLGVAEFSAHDLRRTLRTGLSKLGVDGAVAEAVIGHLPRNALLRTYDLYDRLPERRAALEAWGAHVAKVIAAKPKRRPAQKVAA